MTPHRRRLHPLLKAVLIALLINELRGLVVSAVILAALLITQISTGATLLPKEFMP